MLAASASKTAYEWTLPSPLPEEAAARFPRACRPLLQVLYNRQILGLDEDSGARVKQYLSVSDPDPDPFLLCDMDRAVGRILQEIAANRPIGVFGHYDCDGVTATALLCDALAAMGGQPVPHIPSRADEYGIPINGIERLVQNGVRLIVTVDCGIRAMDEVRKAAAMGVEIIITDHHQCDESDDGEELLPEALAVVNPKRRACRYPFKSLAGVGLSFRLAQALAKAAPDRGLTPDRLEALLDLVCVGTVADIVDLLGENRCLVARGLKQLRKLNRPGLLSLAAVARLAPDHITARDVGFVIAPRINAAARLQHGKLSLALLQAASCKEAAPLAQQLEELNRRRRELTARAVEKACELLGSRVETHDVLVTAGDWAPGISGLVAAQIKERFGRPALAICAPDGNGRVDRLDDYCSGSARSVTGFNITTALHSARHELIRFGGHSGAAGFTVRRLQIPALERALNDYAVDGLPRELIGPRLLIDAELTCADLTAELRTQIERFEPFGQSNPAPLFLIRGVTAMPGSTRGYENDRLSFKVRGPAGPIKVSGQAAGLPLALDRGDVLDLICLVSADRQASGQVRLSLIDAKPASGPARRLWVA